MDYDVGVQWIVNILDSDDESWSQDRSSEQSSTSSSYSESTLSDHYPSSSDSSTQRTYELFNDSHYPESSSMNILTDMSGHYHQYPFVQKEFGSTFANTPWPQSNNSFYMPQPTYSMYPNDHSEYSTYGYPQREASHWTPSSGRMSPIENLSDSNILGNMERKKVVRKKPVINKPGTVSTKTQIVTRPVMTSVPKEATVLSALDKTSLDSFIQQMKTTLDSQGYDACKYFVLENVIDVPKCIHAKICMEMSDIAKRENRPFQAKLFIQTATILDASDVKAWIEYAKMEEENGSFEHSERILRTGIKYCGAQEGLVLRLLRILSSQHREHSARSLLGGILKSSDALTIHNDWKLILEGALVEWKAGKKHLALRILDYVQKSLPTRTQPYVQSIELCKKQEDFVEAYKTIQSGLHSVPNAGILWFEALHVQQLYLESSSIESEIGIPKDWEVYHKEFLPAFTEKAMQSLSSELVWKYYLELASIGDRRQDIQFARKYLYQTVLTTPENLLWKVWMKGSRIELMHGDKNMARKLMYLALTSAPKKLTSTVLLEYARLEEFTGNVDKARYILKKAKKENEKEWKIFLEAILVEMRAHCLDAALEEAKEALEIHPNTGRLWAVWIQIHHLKEYKNIEQGSTKPLQDCIKIFRESLTEVPKSGEVWCEGARLAMHAKSYERARQYLEFALEFTPQYGDSIIEYARLDQLDGNPDSSKLTQYCNVLAPNYGQLWSFCKDSPLEGCLQTVQKAQALMEQENGGPKDLSYQILVGTDLLSLTDEEKRKAIFGW